MTTSTNKLYLIGVATIGLAKVLTQGMPILILALFSKLITTEELGFLSTIVAVITILSVVSDLGLSDTINKFAGEDKKLISPIVFWEIIATVIVGIVILILDLVFHVFRGYGFLLMITVVASSYNVILMAFNGLLRSTEAGVYQFLSSVLFLVFSYIIYILTKDPVQAVLVARLLSWGVFSLIMVYVLRREEILHSTIRLPKNVVKFSIDTLWFSFTELFIAQADVIFVTFVLGDLAAGIYKPATLLASIPMVLGILISTPLVPILVKTLKEKGYLEARKFVYKIALGLAGLCSFGIILTLLIGKSVLEIIYTTEVAEKGFIVFVIFVIANCIYVITMPVTDLLMSIERSSIIRNTAIFRLIVFVVLGIPALNVGGIELFTSLFLFVYTISALIYIYYAQFPGIYNKNH